MSLAVCMWINCVHTACLQCDVGVQLVSGQAIVTCWYENMRLGNSQSIVGLQCDSQYIVKRSYE